MFPRPTYYILLLSIGGFSSASAGKRRTSGSQPAFVEGIDISHYQGEIDWKLLTPERSGKRFVIAKASEGATYRDPTFVDNFRNASAAGFQPGAYHFMRFGTSSPREQMRNFVAQLREAGALNLCSKTNRRKPIVVLDVEERSGDDLTLVGNVTEESVRYLRDEVNITPYIYTGKYFWDAHVAATPDIVKECPLWIARWRQKPPSGRELPKGWSKWTIWQYSDKGSVLGIDGAVDLDKMAV